MQPTGGARAKARSAEPCEPASRGKEQCGAALRGHACDDISRISSAYRFQRRQGSRIVAGKWPPCGERAEPAARSGAGPRSGHARDGFSRSTTWGLHEEFIRLRPGVHRRNGELRPTAPTI